MIIINQILRITCKVVPNVIRTSYCKYSDDIVKLAFTNYNKYNSVEVPLVILPGVFGYRRNYTWMCHLLEDGLNPYRRIITVDLRNHGDSGHSNIHNYEVIGNDLLNFLEEQHLKKVIFMGHSMGGKSAMYVALKFPHLVDKIIVADTAPVAKLSKYRIASILKIVAAAEIKQGGSLMDAQGDLSIQLKKTEIGNENREYIVSQLIDRDGIFTFRANLDSLIQNYKNIVSFPFDTNSGLQYQGPALFVAGELSQTIGPEDNGPIKAFFPKAEIVYIKGASNRLHVNRPSSFSEVIIQFLK